MDSKTAWIVAIIVIIIIVVLIIIGVIWYIKNHNNNNISPLAPGNSPFAPSPSSYLRR